jgi:hypothetical protein
LPLIDRKIDFYPTGMILPRGTCEPKENGLGFLIGGERRWLFLDGIRWLGSSDGNEKERLNQAMHPEENFTAFHSPW